MTTFEEISVCAKANHAFWTERARLSLTCYLIHKRDGDAAAARLERFVFRKAMKHRHERTYLEAAGYCSFSSGVL